MKRVLFQLTMVVGILGSMILSSCNESSVLPGFEDADELNLKAVNVKDSDSDGVPLIAGQSIDAGLVSFADLGDEIEVTYSTNSGWFINEIHFWIGTEFSTLPQNRQGNPKIGQFPYSYTGLNVTSYSFTVTKESLGYTTGTHDYYVVAHAALSSTSGQNETGWGSGSGLSEELATKKGSWAMFFEITISEDQVVDPEREISTETAFAYGASVANDFLEIDENGDGRGDFNRWGWSNGSLDEGSYTFDMYAGAGQSDITKGTHVGTLDVVYSSGTATVTYNINPPYFMIEAQLYVGSEILPRNNGEYTVAPGQYPYNEDVTNPTSHTYVVDNLSGGVYVVAHATVGGF